MTQEEMQALAVMVGRAVAGAINPASVQQITAGSEIYLTEAEKEQIMAQRRAKAEADAEAQRLAEAHGRFEAMAERLSARHNKTGAM